MDETFLAAGRWKAGAGDRVVLHGATGADHEPLGRLQRRNGAQNLKGNVTINIKILF